MESVMASSVSRLSVTVAAVLLSGCVVAPVQQAGYYYPRQQVYVDPAPLYVTPGGYVMPYGYPAYTYPNYNYPNYSYGNAPAFGYPYLYPYYYGHQQDWGQRHGNFRHGGTGAGQQTDSHPPGGGQTPPASGPRPPAGKRTDRD